MSDDASSLGEAESAPWTIVDGADASIACITSASIDDTDRPLAVCVHGFPDSAHTWRHLAPVLDDHGYRVVAPALRGYAPSSVSASGLYQTAASARDLAAIHSAFDGDGGAVLIGHDWGAPIVYGAANSEPDRWSKVVGMAVPPGSALGQSFFAGTAQVKRSWYMFFFQHPLSDAVVANDDLAFIDMLWEDWSPGYDAVDDLPTVKAALREPANLAAALGFYRAALGDGPTDPDLAEIQQAGSIVPQQPLLYLHGVNDGCIGAEVVELARPECGPNVTIDVVDDVGHFLHLESPAAVHGKILEFLR